MGEIISMRILYKPSGPAGEYAGNGYALNHLTGCPHGCTYCYVPDVIRANREAFHSSVSMKKDVLKRLNLDLADLGVLADPIFMSFICDPFPYGHDEVYSLTWMAVQAIHKSGNRLRLLTKNPEAMLEHLDLIADGDEIGTTMVFSKQKASEHWEPNVPGSIARFRSLQKIRELRPGVKLWISFEPIIDPAQTLLMAKRAADIVDTMWFGPLNHAHRMAPGYASLVGNIDWPGFVNELQTTMAAVGFDDYKLKGGLREFCGMDGKPND